MEQLLRWNSDKLFNGFQSEFSFSVAMPAAAPLAFRAIKNGLRDFAGKLVVAALHKNGLDIEKDFSGIEINGDLNGGRGKIGFFLQRCFKGFDEQKLEFFFQ